MQAHRLEEVLDGWPGTDIADRALRKELIIAEMVLFKGRKQKVWKVLWLSAEEETLTILDRIIDERARETPIAEQALRLKADYHYINGNFEEAETAYARLMREFPRGRYQKFAMLRAGESALARFPGVEFDDADLLEAEVYLKDFAQKYPKDAGARKSADPGGSATSGRRRSSASHNTTSAPNRSTRLPTIITSSKKTDPPRPGPLKPATASLPWVRWNRRRSCRLSQLPPK
jgi:hypothetical protein